MATLSKTTQQSYARVADWLVERINSTRGTVPVVAINGAQGSGKSTLAHWLQNQLLEQFQLRGAIISLDDFYCTRAQRRQLAAEVHPLFQTRGVPGTHDAKMGCEKIEELKALQAGQVTVLPRFDKAADDRMPAAEFLSIKGPVDFILFEGWCVGVPPQSTESLQSPVNDLEAEEDRDGRWRRYVNNQLAGPYAEWFGLCDYHLLLAVPSWEQVFEWRQQQEQETAKASGGKGAGLMDDAALRRFMDHYERLTRHALRVLPSKVDVHLRLDLAHSVHVEHLR